MEVAIDPEMLGKVFENLIEENRRKGLGSFYTPREIVHYMCQESLINYLDASVNTQRESIPRADLEALVQLGDQISHYEAVDTRYAGREMPKKVKEYAKLIDEKLADITICDPAVGSGAFPVGMMSEIVRARSALTPYFNDPHERSPYFFKRHAIQNSLYGVDIDPGAIEIAKLRLWLSLVVDEENVKQIKPLPNLSYKIVSGNSLLGIEKNLFNQQLFRQIEEMKQRYFDEPDKQKKDAYKQNIEDTIDELTNGNEAFDFEIYFSEVIDRKRRAGFDVLIANPPYGVRIPKHHREAYTRDLGSVPDFEIFYWFLSLASRVTRQGGALAFIIPNTFLINMHASGFRRAWLEKWKVHVLADLTSLTIFESAVVRNCVVLCERREKAEFSTSVCMFGASKTGTPAIERSVLVSKSELDAMAENWQSIIRTDNTTEPLLKKIESKSLPLGDFVDAKQGYIPYRKTTLTHSFGVQKAKKILENREWHSSKKETSHHKRELQGKDVIRYRIAWSGIWVKYGDWVSSYVDLQYFSKPRLLFREITSSLPYSLVVAYSKEEYVNNPSVITAIQREGSNLDLKFLLGICNSRLVSFHFISRAPKAEKGLFPKILVNDVRRLRIPRVTCADQQEISKKVERILTAKEQNAMADTTQIEREIDQQVYLLYGLTSEEIAIIEGPAQKIAFADSPNGKKFQKPEHTKKRTEKASSSSNEVSDNNRQSEQNPKSNKTEVLSSQIDDKPVRIDETEQNDVLCTIRQMFSEGLELTREEAFWKIAKELGYDRVGSKIEEILDSDIRTAVKRGILENDRGTLRIDCRTIEEFRRDFLKDQFMASIGRVWVEREEAVRSFARFLGFRRAGEKIQDTVRSLINGLLREDRLESDGQLIRRKS